MVNKIGLFLSLIALSACGDNRDLSRVDAPDIIVITGHVITMDPKRPVATYIALEGGSILSVGTGDHTALYPDAVVTNLLNQTILPCFIDSHVHVRELGMDRIKANLVGVENVDEIVARLQAKFPNPEAGKWLIGQGWDEGAFASNGYPDRAALDVAFPDNPVALESLHGFGGFYNGQALGIAGITAETHDPEVGDILRREDGSPTGVMLTLAQDLVDTHIPKADQKKLEEAIVAGLTEMSEAGVTSVHEAGMTGEDVKAFRALAARKALPIRVYGLLDGNDTTLMDRWFDQGVLNDSDDWLDIRGIKVFYDGSLGSRTALMAAPYSDKPEAARPTERIAPEALQVLADRAVEGGFQMAVHAIGDEGNNRTLNIYETFLSEDTSARWRIEHAQVVLPYYYERVAKAGVLSSVQSSHAVGDSAWAEDRVGPDRIKNAYAWQTILGAGGRLMLNSDLPGEPWTPMETLYFAVNRQALDGTPKGGWYSNQALSVAEALKAMTITNAYGAFQEDALGSLEAGKRADFVVLDADPTQVDLSAIKDIRVQQTWVNGQPVYQAD